jgi:hypothetical protein
VKRKAEIIPRKVANWRQSSFCAIQVHKTAGHAAEDIDRLSNCFGKWVSGSKAPPHSRNTAPASVWQLGAFRRANYPKMVALFL